MCRSTHEEITQREISIVDALQGIISDDIQSIIVRTAADATPEVGAIEQIEETMNNVAVPYHRLRRIIRRDPQLSRLDELMRAERRMLREQDRSIDAVFSRASFRIWREDSELVALRHARSLTRQRFARRRRQMRGRLDEVLETLYPTR